MARLLNMPRRMSACPDSVNIAVRALRGRLSLWNSMEGNLGDERKQKDNMRVPDELALIITPSNFRFILSE